MELSSAFSIANSGLANINAQLAILSQNVANASTPGYAAEIGTQTALVANGTGLGVHTGPAVLNIDKTLQASVQQQNTVVSGLTTTQTALQSIDVVLGTPGSGTDIASLLAALLSPCPISFLLFAALLLRSFLSTLAGCCRFPLSVSPLAITSGISFIFISHAA